ncbi:hypothetical protein P3T43_000474 [Paraburkholderia sp. GAS41]
MKVCASRPSVANLSASRARLANAPLGTPCAPLALRVRPSLRSGGLGLAGPERDLSWRIQHETSEFPHGERLVALAPQQSEFRLR